MIEYNANKMIAELKSTLSKTGTKYTEINNSDETKLEIKTDEASLTIEFSEKIIGFDLCVNADVFDKEIGYGEDTDLYPLGGKYATYTNDMAEKITVCLKALLNREILVGTHENRIILVIPTTNNKKVVKSFPLKNRWWSAVSTTQVVDELKPEMKEQLRSLR